MSRAPPPDKPGRKIVGGGNNSNKLLKTPLSNLKNDQHDALMEEFKRAHKKVN